MRQRLFEWARPVPVRRIGYPHGRVYKGTHVPSPRRHVRSRQLSHLPFDASFCTSNYSIVHSLQLTSRISPRRVPVCHKLANQRVHKMPNIFIRLLSSRAPSQRVSSQFTENHPGRRGVYCRSIEYIPRRISLKDRLHCYCLFFQARKYELHRNSTQSHRQ